MTGRAATRRRRLIGAAVLLGAGFGIVPSGAGTAAPGDPPPTELRPAPHVVDVVPATSSSPSVSSDGRIVVYVGPPAIDDGRTSTVWMLDRGTGETTELTTPVADVRIGNSVHPTISADGCKVAVVTEMPYDLFRDDDLGARWDVYDRLLPACDGRADDWELLSTVDDDTDGVRAGDDADPTSAPALSGSGSVAAFVRVAGDGVGPDGLKDAQRLDTTEQADAAGGQRDGSDAAPRTGVDVVDLTVPLGRTGRIRAVAGTPATAPDTTFRYHGIRQPSLSDDGRFVAFTSDAASAASLPRWAGGTVPGGYATSQVFVWDREATADAGAVRPISSPDATPTNGAGDAPSISGDGRYVAFESTSTDLVADAVLPPCPDGPDGPDGPGHSGHPSVPGGCRTQVYRWDRTDGSVVLVSRTAGDPASAPVAADEGAGEPSIGFDGRDVTFLTRSANLFEVNAASREGTNGGTVVVARPDSATLERVSLLPDGIGVAPNAQSAARLASDGRTVVFETAATESYLPPTVPAGGEDPAVAVAAGSRVVLVDRNPQISMADLDIGTVAVGYPSPEWFIGVINNGPAAFVPSAITTSNPNFGITGGTCTPGVAVQPGGSCEVHIILTPSVGGPLKGTLTVAEAGFGAVTGSSELFGSGGEPVLSISPNATSFAPTPVGQPSEPTAFQVTNVGYAPADVVGVATSGASPNDFRIDASDCGRVLQIGESCSVTVSFTPTAGALRTASVSASTDAGQYASALVSGTGTYTSELLVSADRVFTGSRFGIGGNGFLPFSAVTMHWSDGSGGTYTALTNRSGSFLMSAEMASNERPGRRTLVAQSTTGQSAAAEVVVVPGFAVSSGPPGLTVWPAG